MLFYDIIMISGIILSSPPIWTLAALLSQFPLPAPECTAPAHLVVN